MELHAATDICLMPSRDEPFGYVDIEFGLYGALCVGFLVGGLGKMPGVYARATSYNRLFLTQQLKNALDNAMRLPQVSSQAGLLEPAMARERPHIDGRNAGSRSKCTLHKCTNVAALCENPPCACTAPGKGSKLRDLPRSDANVGSTKFVLWMGTTRGGICLGAQLVERASHQLSSRFLS